MKHFITALLISLSLAAFPQSNIIYNVVLTGGHVINPETKLDAIKNVGILNNQIVQSAVNLCRELQVNQQLSE